MSGSPCIRKQQYDKAISLVDAVKIVGYQNLRNSEWGITVGTRWMWHTITNVAMTFGFPHKINLRVYSEYRVPGKTNFRHKSTGKEHELRQLSKTLKRDRQATLHISVDFNCYDINTYQRAKIWTDHNW